MFAPHRYKNAQGSDPNFENVSLLLHGDGTNGAQNNTFLDSSTNNFTITRNGTPTQGSFSPYGNSWSNYFPSQNDKLTLPTTSVGSSLDYGTGSFTIECFYYLQSISSLGIGIIISQAVFGINNLLLAVYADRRVEIWLGNINLGSSAAGVVPLNSWCHMALVRNGSSVTVYVNGTSVFTATNSSSVGGNMVPCINGYGHAGNYGNICYISNIRIVKGTALYTSNFTPSTSNLTAVAGTSLLTCQSNRFIDNSSNNFTITANGTPSVQPNSPFNPTSEYSITVNGGSGYFNGTTDYLQVPSNPAFNFSSGIFTAEFWFMTTNSGVVQTILNNYISATNGWVIGINTSNKIGVNLSGDANDIVGTTTILRNVWYHIAVSGSAGSYKLFINGIQEGATYTGATSLAGGKLGIGAIGDSSFVGVQKTYGYISNIRIVNGTALYTSNFTPPEYPVTAVANTSLLCNFTNAGIFDNSAKNNLLTVGTARVSTAQKKYGSGSMLFNGSTDYLELAINQTLNFGSSNFTIEGWVYPSNVTGLYSIFTFGPPVQVYVGSSTIRAWFNSVDSTAGYIVNDLMGPANSVSINTWNHFAVVRNGTTFTIYVNGIAGASATGVSQSIAYSTRKPYVGIASGGTSPYYYGGYIDDFRITKGIARYTANFTPPTQAFPNL